MKGYEIEVDLEVNARYTCSFCGYKTGSADNIVNHMVLVHSENEDEVWDEIVNEVYQQFQLAGSDFWLGR